MQNRLFVVDFAAVDFRKIFWCGRDLRDSTQVDLATANAVRAGMDPALPALTAPADGWPVVIFQHGIAQDKSNAAAIAGTLAIAGFATVAIDHPLHGDRGFDFCISTASVYK